MDTRKEKNRKKTRPTAGRLGVKPKTIVRDEIDRRYAAGPDEERPPTSPAPLVMAAPKRERPVGFLCPVGHKSAITAVASINR
jgi:hypothetical protein